MTPATLSVVIWPKTAAVEHRKTTAPKEANREFFGFIGVTLSFRGADQVDETRKRQIPCFDQL
jgi:hypothetical protein